MPRTAVIVTGGEPFHRGALGHLPADTFVIAVDSGLDQAYAAGLEPDLVVGDLDSVSADGLARAEAAGVPIERHPTAKDATDTELALDAALARGHDHLVVLTGGGGRLDHELAALGLLGGSGLRGRTVEAYWAAAHIQVLHGPQRAAVIGPAGACVTLLALHGPAGGVSTSGLRYPLHDDTLTPASSRGVSNELLGGPAEVALERGVLLVITPDALGGAP